MKNKSNRSPGRPRHSEQKQPTNQIILQSATQLFLEKGFQEVSVDDVANECNVTKATVYYYYDSKAELFTETMVQMMFRIREHMQVILQGDQPLRARLLQVAEAHLTATVNIDLEGFMREMKNALTADQIKKVQEAEESMYEELEKAFVDAMENGEISEVHSKFTAHAYLSLLKVGNYRNSDQTAIFPSTQETAEHIVDFFWNGLSGA